jgi:hypothetical protein
MRSVLTEKKPFFYNFLSEYSKLSGSFFIYKKRFVIEYIQGQYIDNTLSILFFVTEKEYKKLNQLSEFRDFVGACLINNVVVFFVGNIAFFGRHDDKKTYEKKEKYLKTCVDLCDILDKFFKLSLESNSNFEELIIKPIGLFRTKSAQILSHEEETY